MVLFHSVGTYLCRCSYEKIRHGFSIVIMIWKINISCRDNNSFLKFLFIICTGVSRQSNFFSHSGPAAKDILIISAQFTPISRSLAIKHYEIFRYASFRELPLKCYKFRSTSQATKSIGNQTREALRAIRVASLIIILKQLHLVSSNKHNTRWCPFKRKNNIQRHNTRPMHIIWAYFQQPLVLVELNTLLK